MLKIFEFEKFKWFYVINPKTKDFDLIKKEFNLHEIHLKELKKPSSKGKFEKYSDYLFYIIELPIYIKEEATVFPKEIDIVIKNDKVLTLIYEEFKPVDEFLIKIDENDREISTPEFIYRFLRKNFEFLLREIRYIKYEIDKINKEIINPSKETISHISKIKREVLDFIKIIEPQKISLEKFIKESEQAFLPKERPYFEYLKTLFNEILIYIENYKEILDSQETTSQNVLTIKTNEAIKFLTIIAVFTFPLSLIGVIFSMRAKSTPIIGLENDFYIIITLMALVALFMFYIFKRKEFF